MLITYKRPRLRTSLSPFEGSALTDALHFMTDPNTKISIKALYFSQAFISFQAFRREIEKNPHTLILYSKIKFNFSLILQSSFAKNPISITALFERVFL